LGQRRSKHDALSLTAGKGAKVALREFGRVGQIHRAPDGGPIPFAFEQPARIGGTAHENHLFRGKREIDFQALRDKGDQAGEIAAIPFLDGGVVEPAVAGRCVPQSCHDAQQSGLACAVWSGECDHLGVLEAQGDVA